MKVCMSVNNVVTIDARVKGEAAALRAAGHEVTIIGRWKKGYASEEMLDGIRVIRPKKGYTMPYILWNLFLASPAVFRGMKGLRERFTVIHEKRKRKVRTRVLKAQRADVYHAHDCDTLAECSAAAKSGNALLVYDSHELWLDLHINKNHTIQAKVDRWILDEFRHAPEADLVITVCENIARRLQNMYTLDRLPTVVYNCSPLREFQHMDYLRETYLHTPADRRTVLYQGGVQKGRGLSQFIDLARLMPEYDFVVIGPVIDRELEESLKAQSSSLDNVFILPPVGHDELWKITCSADFGYVCTEPYCDSYRFSMTNKMFAYLVAGIPIIANDLPGHREMEEQCPDGVRPLIIVSMDDLPSAADSIRAVADDGEKYARMAQDSYTAARDVFNREREHAKLTEEYGKLEAVLREKRNG